MSSIEIPHENPEAHDEAPRPVVNEKPQPRPEAPDAVREPIDTRPKPKAPVETALGKLAKEIEGTKGKIGKEQLKTLVGDAKAEYDKYQKKTLAPDLVAAYEQDAKMFRAIDESKLERHVRKELKALKNTIRTVSDANAPQVTAAEVKDFASYKAYRESKGERNVNKFDYLVFRATTPFRAIGRLVGISR